ncbi:hypothetical protein HKD37_01G000918 [Glycine soja]
MKNTIFHSRLLQNATQSLTPLSPPPTTTGGCYEPLLLAAEPPHLEEHFNLSGILLKDLVEKIPPILHFKASLRSAKGVIALRELNALSEHQREILAPAHFASKRESGKTSATQARA